MKFSRRICCLFLSLLLLLPGGALAVDYTDLPETHWAYDDMIQAVSLGVLNGMGDNTMAPEGTLTWGQYLTMLARVLDPKTYALYRETLAWDAAGYQYALDVGLLAAGDFMPVALSDLGHSILRKDVAVLLYRAIRDMELSLFELPSSADSEEGPATAATTFSDWNTLGAKYQEAISTLYDVGVIRGRSDGTFGGEETLHRSDGTVLLMRILPIVDQIHTGELKTITLHLLDEEGGILCEDKVIEQAEVGFDEISTLADMACAPMSYTVKSYEAVTTAVTSFTDVYTVTMRPYTQAERDENSFQSRLATGSATYEDYLSQNFWLRYKGENAQKKLLLFGDSNKRRYSSQSEALQHMTTITVPMWRIDKNGNKYASEGSFPINAAIAGDVIAIFTEIFNDPEQFPIRDMCGYGWRGDRATGEHNCGTAIDINPNENYQIRNGRIETGSLWKPGENPYSIGTNSSVVRIFAEHGWSWGGDAWAGHSNDSYGYHDYMHFSYMGW